MSSEARSFFTFEKQIYVLETKNKPFRGFYVLHRVTKEMLGLASGAETPTTLEVNFSDMAFPVNCVASRVPVHAFRPTPSVISLKSYSQLKLRRKLFSRPRKTNVSKFAKMPPCVFIFNGSLLAVSRMRQIAKVQNAVTRISDTVMLARFKPGAELQKPVMSEKKKMAQDEEEVISTALEMWRCICWSCCVIFSGRSYDD